MKNSKSGETIIIARKFAKEDYEGAAKYTKAFERIGEESMLEVDLCHNNPKGFATLQKLYQERIELYKDIEFAGEWLGMTAEELREARQKESSCECCNKPK